MRDGTPDPTRLLVAAAIGLLLLLAAQWLLAQPLDATARFDADVALARSSAALGRALPDLALTRSDGARVPLRRAGRPLVVSFVYTGCFAVCPTATAALARAVREARARLGDDAFDVVTVGFNLPFDTPAAMREFAQRQGVADPRWQFLTPDPVTLDALAAAVGFTWKPVAGGFDHVTQVTLVDAQGRVARQLIGERLEPRDLELPLAELVAGRALPGPDTATGWLDGVRALCTVYDPRSGRYVLNYGLFIEIFAGLSVVGATVGYLVAGSRRRREGAPPTAGA